ncbi:MAG TPA: hypothetical protein VFR33_13730 [Candidatus Dormibacteraeota bacterium]|nr:hypothetical protein [Candidatus Dormibacteraeota bacterium]
MPQAAVVWAMAYGVVRIWWAVGPAPAFGARGDLIAFSGWGVVGLCAAAAIVAVALLIARWWWWLLFVAWTVTAALLVSCAVLLLDVVGGLLPGMGVDFYPVGFASRAGCLVAAILMAAAAEAYRRRWRSACLFCGRTRMAAQPTKPQWWAWCAAYLTVAGCLLRLGAQAAVGFGTSLAPVGGSLVIFEAGFLLAGTVLPLALVHSWGRVVPRWSPLLAGRRIPRWLVLAPASAIAVAMTMYFGVTVVALAAATLSGSSAGFTGSLPLAFFWASVPAYLAWGIGLGIAGVAYYRMTRPRCRVCGR